MQLSPALSGTHIYQKHSLNVAGSRTPSPTSSDKVDTDSVSLSHAGKYAEKNWQAIAEKYDVTNISTHERGEMAADLMNAGLMPPGIGIALVVPIGINHDPNTKIDFLDASRQSLSFGKAHGAPQEQTLLMQKTVNLLEKIKALSIEE